MSETCPSRSPESNRACHLPDRADAHTAGHESAIVGISRSSWAIRWEDLARWGLSEQEWRAARARQIALKGRGPRR